MRQTGVALVASVACAVLCGAYPALAQTAPSLGSAQSYAVMGASTVTNTGLSIVSGDLGLSPGAAVVGFPPGSVILGTIHAADGAALAAQNSITTAFTDLDQPCTLDLTGQDLGTLAPLPAGVYCFATTAQLTGTLTLNAAGNPDAVFIFKVGTALTTASNAIVQVINGGQTCKVFWRIGSSATLGSGTAFAGNILAQVSITLVTNTSLAGRAFARTGAVTLDTNNVTATSCAAPGPGCTPITLSPAPVPNGTVGVPYSQTIVAIGGLALYTFGITAGALPTGLGLSTGGVIAGTPTAAGPFTFSVTATDADPCAQAYSYPIVIINAVPTLPQWGAAFLFAGLLGLGLRRLRGRSAGSPRAS